MPEAVTTSGGREIAVFGHTPLLTGEVLDQALERFDADPRIASISLVPGRQPGWLRASAPAGTVVAVAVDLVDLTGPMPSPADSPDAIAAWAHRASERGLWHDWLIVDSEGVSLAPMLLNEAQCDAWEATDPTSAAYAVREGAPGRSGPLTIAVDVTWLGPYQTGAQVLTTAAIEALATRDDVAELRLFGLPALPGYAAHLQHSPKVALLDAMADSGAEPADIVWYPNQIDHRSSIGMARRVGARVVTTYLDLIAYDIPRYHGSPAAWQSYRRLQRRIALSCDGITAISGDVAHRLLQEVPRLESARVLALPLGLDHIRADDTATEPDADLGALRSGLQGRPFVLVLGNDFQHKNRDLAIRAWLDVARTGSDCDLVLAGLHVRTSSSRLHEHQALKEAGPLRERVHVVDHVSPASRQWLLAEAAVVLYPSSAEGFGFVPYEAAVLGTPSVFCDFGPLREISGASGLPRGWSVEGHAHDLSRLLTDADARTARISELAAAIQARTWADFAADLVAFFDRIRALPPAPTSLLGSEQTAEAAQLNAILSSRTYRAIQRLRRLLGRG